jgi:hypothetical protein
MFDAATSCHGQQRCLPILRRARRPVFDSRRQSAAPAAVAPRLVGPAAPPGPPAPRRPADSGGPRRFGRIHRSALVKTVCRISCPAQHGLRISGHFQFDGALAKSRRRGIVQSLSRIDPADRRASVRFSAARYKARVDQDGTITTYEVPPGKYYDSDGGAHRLPGKPCKAGPSSLRLSMAEDVAGTPLNLQGDGDEPGHHDDRSSHRESPASRGDPAVGPIRLPGVLVFSADRNDWSGFGETPRKLRNLKPNRTGGFRVVGLPPGQLFRGRHSHAQAGDWQDPRSFKPYPDRRRSSRLRRVRRRPRTW